MKLLYYAQRHMLKTVNALHWQYAIAKSTGAKTTSIPVSYSLSV